MYVPMHVYIHLRAHDAIPPTENERWFALCVSLSVCVCVVTVCSTDRIMQALAELKVRGLGVSLSLYIYKKREWQRSEGEWGRAGCLEGMGEGLGGGRDGGGQDVW